MCDPAQVLFVNSFSGSDSSKWLFSYSLRRREQKFLRIIDEYNKSIGKEPNWCFVLGQGSV